MEIVKSLPKDVVMFLFNILNLFIKSTTQFVLSSKLIIICVLLMFPVVLQVISTAAVETTINRGESNLPIEDLSNRIMDYTSKIFNITTITTYALAKNERKHLLSNVFPSSFIFYMYESYSNLIDHDDILQKHYIFKMPRYKNVSKTQKERGNQHNQHNHNSEEALAFDEDYFLEYEDNFTSKSGKNTPNVTTGPSCSSCQHHEKTKKETLESIKKNILMRLQITQPPNITNPLLIVPQKILDNFYKNSNYSRTMTPQSVYKQHYNNNRIHKKRTKETSSNVEDEMRGDDANDSSRTLNEDHDNDDIMISDNRYDYFDDDFSTFLMQADEFYSRLHSIYVFPTKSRILNNRKPEIFNFKFNSDPSRISSSILHIFIKGQNWIYEYQRDMMEKTNMDVSIKKKQEITIIIYRVLRRSNSMNYTHTVKLIESRHQIPPGKGQWVEIEIKELSKYWMKTPNTTQSIVIRGMESWMSNFIVTDDQSNDKSLTMHIEIVTKVKNRYKRNAALDCRESDNEVRCCRYPLKVNFTNFGWNFIVAPQHFDAYFCNGECNVGYLEEYTHTHITSLSTSAKPCCSPQKLSPLALLYFDNNNKLMYSTIPNMSVEKCSCS